MYRLITPIFSLLKKIQSFVINLTSTITKEKIDTGLRKIEEENKHLSEMEIIKLKSKFLDEIDKILDIKIDKIDLENDREIRRIERQYL